MFCRRCASCSALIADTSCLWRAIGGPAPSLAVTQRSPPVLFLRAGWAGAIPASGRRRGRFGVSRPKRPPRLVSQRSLCARQCSRAGAALRFVGCRLALLIAFRIRNGVGSRDKNLCEAQWLACVLLYRRFAAALTGGCARLEVDVVSYSFIVSDLHRLLVAGLPAHCERFCTLSAQIDRAVLEGQMCAIDRLETCRPSASVAAHGLGKCERNDTNSRG